MIRKYDCIQTQKFKLNGSMNIVLFEKKIPLLHFCDFFMHESFEFCFSCLFVFVYETLFLLSLFINFCHCHKMLHVNFMISFVFFVPKNIVFIDGER